MKINWIGCKKKMLPQLLNNIPTNYNNYYEPFLGSGVLLQTLQPKKSILNDNDINLIELWKNMLEKPKPFYDYICKFENDIYTTNDQIMQKATFKLLLGIFNKINFCVAKSAIFYVLLKYAFRGIFRYRNDGTIHLGFGFKSRFKNPIINLTEIQRIKSNFTNSKLLNTDFETVIKQSQSNDFIFVDPPYFREGIKDKSFYQKAFTFDDHIRLYKTLKSAHQSNVKWLYTNYNSPQIIDLFKDFNIKKNKTTTDSNLTSKSAPQEVIISNY